MHLVDLHRHLDGSMRPDTLMELSDAAGHPLAAVPKFSPGMGLQAALDCFAITLAALQTPDAVRRVASECCEDALAEGVAHLELRFAPQLHLKGDLSEILDAAIEGVAGRAGLILCGLYGEDPAALGRCVDLARQRPEVVGIDLAGGPTRAHRWGLLDYADVYSKARDIGLGRTVHAGEGRPAREIIEAILHLDAQRIGHGLSILDDDEAVKLAIDRGVTIEACPTSNWQVGILPSPGAHPVHRWLKRGLRVSICTDNTMLSQTSLPEELRRVGAPVGTPEADRLTQMGQAALFARRTG